MFPCKVSFYRFLNKNNLLSLLYFCIVKVVVFCALILSSSCFSLSFSFLQIDSFKCSYNTLTTSLDFLNDTNGSFHISVKRALLLDDFFLR